LEDGIAQRRKNYKLNKSSLLLNPKEFLAMKLRPGKSPLKMNRLRRHSSQKYAQSLTH
jgi:hypothetical protein